MKLLLLFSLFVSSLFASEDAQLQKMVGRMLLVGFADESINEKSQIVQQIQKYDLGGVILFDRFYDDRTKTKNISSPAQLQKLTASLKSFSKKPLLISVDQEGGKVARLNPKYGFEATPSASRVAQLDAYMTTHVYNALARTLVHNGINCNFAPVVDLGVNPDNKVIYGLGRSYGDSSKEVAMYAKIMMTSLKNNNVISVLKHFPGHGSSLGDSHEGFVDISNTWNKEELEPYRELIASGDAAMIMSAHVFNSNLDATYPATLSHNVNTKLLREELGFKGVLVSDDLQMGALASRYTLEEIVTLSINSGVDMLLFGNQLASQDIDELVAVIVSGVKKGSISLDRIKESNGRIEKLVQRYKF